METKLEKKDNKLRDRVHFNVNINFYSREKRGCKISTTERQIYCRIFYEAKRVEFGTGLHCQPNEFINGQFIESSNKLAEMQRSIDLIRAGILKIFNDLRSREQHVTAQKLVDIFRGKLKLVGFTFAEVAQEYLQQKKLLIGKDFTQKMYDRYEIRIQFFQSYLDSLPSPITLDEINEEHMNAFYVYCRSTLNHGKPYIRKHFQTIKAVVELAVRKDYLRNSKIAHCRVKLDKQSNIKNLSVEQVKVIAAAKFASQPLNHVRDCFLFQCYTGLAFTDMSKFSMSNLKFHTDGSKWISINRQKTDTKSLIPIFDECWAIIMKYQDQQHRALHAFKYSGLLPVYHNSNMNKMLKQIALICNIPIELMTTHVARKTFAMTMLNVYGASIETVSCILGHSETRTTQKYYAKVSEERIINEISSKNFFKN